VAVFDAFDAKVGRDPRILEFMVVQRYVVAGDPKDNGEVVGEVVWGAGGWERE
jgi:hypothetical protein